MNSKKIIYYLILIALLIIIIFNTNLFSNNNKQISNNTVNETKENISDEILNGDHIKSLKDPIVKNGSHLDLSIDIQNKKVRYNNASNIAIVKVTKINGAQNYHPVTKEETAVMTYGELEIISNIKGNTKGNKINFVRLGGTINQFEFEKNLPESVKFKLANDPDIEKLSEEEKKNTWFDDYSQGNVKLEEGKSYLMYLDYIANEDLYNSLFFEEGTRELAPQKRSEVIKETSKFFNRSSETINIQVKNNVTGTFENIKDVIY